MTRAADVAHFLDETLRTREVPDYPGAVNGLQLASRGEVRRVAAAVDFSSQTVAEARARDADLLLVHHGMFWGGIQPIRDLAYERLASLFEADIAVYASHLPLDVHPTLGNNVLLAERLGLTPGGGFARHQAMEIGVSGEADLETDAIVSKAAAFAGEHGGSVRVTSYPPGRRTRRWGICTGAGASSDTVAEALDRRLDTVIVGEGPHHTAVQARDVGLVIVYAGHYATETLGVQALAGALEREFGVTSTFIEAPTGL